MVAFPTNMLNMLSGVPSTNRTVARVCASTLSYEIIAQHLEYGDQLSSQWTLVFDQPVDLCARASRNALPAEPT